jgi:hypothetical protein
LGESLNLARQAERKFRNEYGVPGNRVPNIQRIATFKPEANQPLIIYADAPLPLEFTV